MAGGAVSSAGTERTFTANFTWYMFFSCVVAASGGALFGWDNGVTGGVVAMTGFLEQFFPETIGKESTQAGDLYCTYNNQKIQWFTSSLFLAGAATELSGTTAYLNRKAGRKFTMAAAGVMFEIGGIILAAAMNYEMLIIGRCFLGVAISFASVSVPMYNSEMAPPQLRGRLNQLFQIVLTFAIFAAQMINIGTSKLYPWGWRLSLGLCMVPATVLLLGGIFLDDTPNSLCERGHPEKARHVLEKIRGTKDVDEEFQDILEKAELAALVKNPWTLLLFRKKYRPQLVCAACSTLFQQWTGINTIIFYAPQLFLSLGGSQQNALIATVIVGLCNHFSTYISFWLADHYGRRFLLIEAGFQMLVALIVIAISLAQMVPAPTWLGWYTLAFILLFDSAYAWSWGPLGWLYPFEIQPLETRPAGGAVASLMNLLFSFVIGQTYLSMLCALKWGVFVLFACCVFLMTLSVYLFFPETKGVPIEDCPYVFKHHWYWKKFANIEDKDAIQEKILHKKKAADAAESGKVGHGPSQYADGAADGAASGAQARNVEITKANQQ
ncbi:g3716 [Coccomyxa viridis]|uniref:G3716 protein n=1 Tax=Coccomyxa viridis TaxID=1274662 RepID=A0ABP1FRE3_9CHLO